MWIWEISTGKLYDDELSSLAFGYSGGNKGLNPEGINNASMQYVHEVGPLPEGLYRILAPHDDPHTGPYTLDLVPDPSNRMHGRSGFRIHGDNKHANRSASEGCAILPRSVREQVWNSGDHDLKSVVQVEAMA